MSGIVSNQILFIGIKLIGSLVIIFMMKKCLELNKKISFIGMKLIIFIMFFVVLNNIMVINANALSFANLSVGGTGAVSSGNGYFDNPMIMFNYSTDDRNVFILTEDRQINIIEPTSFTSGAGNAFNILNSSLGTLKSSVLLNGYLYFVDGTSLKKRLTRNSAKFCESTDTTPGGCVLIITTSADETIRVSNNRLYYNIGTAVYYLDSNDNPVASTLVLPQGTGGNFGLMPSWGIVENGTTQLYAFGYLATGQTALFRCTTSCTAITTTLGANTGGTNQYASYYTMTNYIYILVYATNGVDIEEIIRYSNGTATTVNYISVDTISQQNRLSVGGKSTVGLAAVSASSYETFNSIQSGIDSIYSEPAQLIYNTKTVTSLDSQYYNKSDIYLSYNIVLDLLANNFALDFQDYRWMISLQDPNGIITDIVQSPNCGYSGILDTTCQIDSTMGIHAPSGGWLQGTWYAKLYEINIVDPNRALIVTSSAFTVLNTSLENQSVISPPFVPITSGTAPQAISLIDGFVSWLGLGVNTVSKFLFAGIIIAICGAIGFIIKGGNGNIAMVFAFLPYAFFSMIDYIPKWVFIISIILFAIASRVFR